MYCTLYGAIGRYINVWLRALHNIGKCFIANQNIFNVISSQVTILTDTCFIYNILCILHNIPILIYYSQYALILKSK